MFWKLKAHRMYTRHGQLSFCLLAIALAACVGWQSVTSWVSSKVVGAYRCVVSTALPELHKLGSDDVLKPNELVNSFMKNDHAQRNGWNLVIVNVMPDLENISNCEREKICTPSDLRVRCPPTKHVVRRGETLADLAELYYRSPVLAYLITEANPLIANGKIETGTSLFIPDLTAYMPLH